MLSFNLHQETREILNCRRAYVTCADGHAGPAAWPKSPNVWASPLGELGSISGRQLGFGFGVCIVYNRTRREEEERAGGMARSYLGRRPPPDEAASSSRRRRRTRYFSPQSPPASFERSPPYSPHSPSYSPVSLAYSPTEGAYSPEPRYDEDGGAIGDEAGSEGRQQDDEDRDGPGSDDAQDDEDHHSHQDRDEEQQQSGSERYDGQTGEEKEKRTKEKRTRTTAPRSTWRKICRRSHKMAKIMQ